MLYNSIGFFGFQFTVVSTPLGNALKNYFDDTDLANCLGSQCLAKTRPRALKTFIGPFLTNNVDASTAGSVPLWIYSIYNMYSILRKI